MLKITKIVVAFAVPAVLALSLGGCGAQGASAETEVAQSAQADIPTVVVTASRKNGNSEG